MDDDEDAQPSTPSRGQGPPSSSPRNSRRNRPQGTRGSGTAANASGSTPQTPRRATAPRPSTRTRIRTDPAPLNIDSSRESSPRGVTPPFSPLRPRQTARTRFGHGRLPSPPSPRRGIPDHFPSEDSDEEFPDEINGEVVCRTYVSPIRKRRERRERAECARRDKERKKKPRPPPNLKDVIEISDSDGDAQPSPSRSPPRKRKRAENQKQSPRKKSRQTSPGEVIVINDTSDEEENERPAPATRPPTPPPFSDVEYAVMADLEDIGGIFDGPEDDPAEIMPLDVVFVDDGQDGVGDSVEAQPPVSGAASVDVGLLASVAEVEEGPATREQYEAGLLFDRELASIATLDVIIPPLPPSVALSTRPAASPALLRGPGVPSSPLSDPVAVASSPSVPTAPAPALRSPTPPQPSTKPNSTPAPSSSRETIPERSAASASTQPVPTPATSAAVTQQSADGLASSSNFFPTPAPARLDATTTQSVPPPTISVVSNPPSNFNSTTTSPPLTDTTAYSVASASNTRPATTSAASARRSLLPPSNSNLAPPTSARREPTPARLTTGSSTRSAPPQLSTACPFFGSPSDLLSHRRQSRPPPRPSTSESYWDGINPPNRPTTYRIPSQPKRAREEQDKAPAGSNSFGAFGYTPPPLSPTSDSTLGGTPPMNSVVPLALTWVTSEEGTVVKRVEVGNRMCVDAEDETEEEVDELADDLDELMVDLPLAYPPSP
ncbi:hypothetical protein C8F04DRAFT_1070656 [Mycena alexandri]|uniref:Uncharacterized protein n=1 Tax=Mycena alexandri TaxID=1745969 RepID=A0AAD6XBJ2_9AGAR|nr:hypothetical protein C8F04DRAFT_1070656 [Mycena alexandri]